MGLRSLRQRLPQFSEKSQEYPQVRKNAVNFANIYGYDDVYWEVFMPLLETILGL